MHSAYHALHYIQQTATHLGAVHISWFGITGRFAAMRTVCCNYPSMAPEMWLPHIRMAWQTAPSKIRPQWFLLLRSVIFAEFCAQARFVPKSTQLQVNRVLHHFFKVVPYTMCLTVQFRAFILYKWFSQRGWTMPEHRGIILCTWSSKYIFELELFLHSHQSDSDFTCIASLLMAEWE